MTKADIAAILAHAFRTARYILNETADNGVNHVRASAEMVSIVREARFYGVFDEFNKLI